MLHRPLQADFDKSQLLPHNESEMTEPNKCSERAKHMKLNHKFLYCGLSVLAGVAFFGVTAALAQDKKSDDESFKNTVRSSKAKLGGPTRNPWSGIPKE